MKKLKLISVIAVLAIFSLSFRGDVEDSQTLDKSEMLFMQVNQYNAVQAGVYIFKDGQLVEKKDLTSGNKSAMNNGKVISTTFSELKSDGWQLHQANGGDMIQNYVWIKNKN